MTTDIAILGGAGILAPEEARVSVGGFAFLGGRRVDVQSRPDVRA
jgi:hypothetical protein